MTQAEARQQFATSHLYWHGSHCWDAMTPSRRVVHRVRENVQREAQRDAAKMLTDDPPPPAVSTPPESSANEAPSPSVNWENRWVEIGQVNPTLASDKAEQEDTSPNAAHKIDPIFTPMRVLFACLSLVLTLLACALTPRWERRRARRNLGLAKFIYQVTWVMSPRIYAAWLADCPSSRLSRSGRRPAAFGMGGRVFQCEEILPNGD